MVERERERQACGLGHAVRTGARWTAAPRTTGGLLAGVFAICTLHVEMSHASGFALLEQSASRLGTAFAGTAVAADDVTTLFFNPAGLVELDGTRASLIGSAIEITSEFHDQGSRPALGQPLGNDGGDAGDWNFVPSAYLSTKLNQDLALGIGINAPFGLKLEYDQGWMGRFQALNSEIRTINVNPALAYRVNERFSIGVGANYQRIDAELTNAVNYSAIIFQGINALAGGGAIDPTTAAVLLAANQGVEGHTRVKGDDTAWGYNIGLLFDVSATTRLALSYRSATDYEVEGTVRFTDPPFPEAIGQSIIASLSGPGGNLSDGPVSVDLKLPDSAIASVRQLIGEDFQLLADAAWTGWSSVQELAVIRDDGTPLPPTPEHWEDTWRFALGGAYRLNPNLKLRGGIAHDETPVPDSTRTPRLPDVDRTWVAIGAQWKVSDAVTLEAGYAHLFSDEVPLNQDAGNEPLNGALIGEQSSDVDVLSVQVQVTW